MENEEKDLKEKDNFPKKAVEDNLDHSHRRLDNMPREYEGRGPQENMAIGYDALEDI